MTKKRKLMAIVEQGGYPNFTRMYQSCGFEVNMQHNMRKALSVLRKDVPDIIIAEFNYQSDFRDRTSSLESLLATVERLNHKSDNKIKVLVFYETEYQVQLGKLQSMFNNFSVLPFPVNEQELMRQIDCDAKHEFSA